ncbi:hypothetical protein HEP81_08055 (plasmid) [Streptomyces griseofuscus]|uniref:Uncharacterized protein n=1 Tax=Streptomyces griseofuscus TaxID=146922 RepID=A0A7H1QDA3_9ACTN|nr:hypothetical protein HEP81_08051 [Streptomyces griseofuscus]QNT98283.1 hypothetical protein HEP81_08055 [Streptomyces griseofuscus]
MILFAGLRPARFPPAGTVCTDLTHPARNAKRRRIPREDAAPLTSGLPGYAVRRVGTAVR